MKFITAAALLGVTNAGGAVPPPAAPKWTYQQQDKWAEKAGYEACGEPGGSPINLETNPSTAYDTYNILEDDFTKVYTNQRDIQIKWNAAITNTEIVLNTKPNMFSSNYAKVKFGGHAIDYNAESVNFHYKGEHTIDGREASLEMQIVHKADTQDASADAVGNTALLCVLFS